MASVNLSGTNSNNTNSTNSTSATRITGLATGLDTDALVKSMTATTTEKINKAMQQKQQLTWKQDAYRSITTALTAFQTKYLDKYNGAGTASFWNTSAATVSSTSYLTATASSNATASSINIKDILSLATSAKVQGSSTVSNVISMAVKTDSLGDLSGKAMKVSLNGVTKTIQFATGSYTSTADASTALQGLVDKAFGSGKITVSASGDTISMDSSGNKLIITDAGQTGNEASSVLGFTNGASNRINLNAALSDTSLKTDPGDTYKFTINGAEFNFTSSDSLSNIINKINTSKAGVTISYSTMADKFVMTAKDTGANNNITMSDSTGNLLGSLFGAGISTDGTDAQLVVSTGMTDADGKAIYNTITRSSNTFDIDGVSVTLKGMAAGTAEENVTIGVASDVDAMVNKVKDFINAYNDILNKVSTALNETRYKDYPPLTDDQKKQMSETQISQWEEKAKSGMLNGDTILQKIYSSLRSSMYTNVKSLTDGSYIGISLNDIGITTGVYTDRGKLSINEDKLRTALTERPDEVINLLTQKSSVNASSSLTTAQKTQRMQESGLAWRLGDLLNSMTNTIPDPVTKARGDLIEAAGLNTGSSQYTNTISNKLKNLSTSIDTLNEYLTKQQTIYYNKFATLEANISKMNSTSSYVTNMFNNNNSST